MFFRVQVFLGPCFSGSRFIRVRVQVLEVALCIYMEITLRHRYSPVNLLYISEHIFIRTPLKDCFCMFKLWFLCFCITSFILRIMWALICFHSLIRRISHWEVFFKEAVLHLYSKVTWRSSSFSSFVCSKLTNLLN